MKTLVGAVEKRSGLLRVVMINDVKDMNNTQMTGGTMDEITLACHIRNSGSIPINFTVNGNSIVQNRGKFDRLDLEKYSTVFVILARLETKTGRLVGYRVFNCANCTVGNIRKEELVREVEHGSCVQNAILRKGVFACFEGDMFESICVGNSSAGKGKASSKSKGTSSEKRKKLSYSNEQREVLEKYKKDPSKKALVKYFANPDLTPKKLEFWGDRVVSQDFAKECKPIIMNSKLSMNQMDALYRCALVGIDYSDLCDENISESVMDVEYKRRYMEQWGDLPSEPEIDEELIIKAMGVRSKA